jgi:hypothetical protein
MIKIIKNYFFKEPVSSDWIKVLMFSLGFNIILHTILYNLLEIHLSLLFVSIFITSILLFIMKVIKRCDQNVKKELNKSGKSYKNVKAAKNYNDYTYKHDYSDAERPETHLPEADYIRIKEWVKLKQKLCNINIALYVLIVLMLIILSYSKRYLVMGIVFLFA